MLQSENDQEKASGERKRKKEPKKLSLYAVCAEKVSNYICRYTFSFIFILNINISNVFSNISETLL